MPLSRPIHRSFVSGIIMTPRFGKSFSLLPTPGFSFSLRSGSQGTVPGRRKRRRRAPARPIYRTEEKGFCGIESTRDRSSARTRIDLRERGSRLGILARPDGREKNLASHTPARHFTRMAASTYSRANIFAGIHERDKSRTPKKNRSSSFTDGFKGRPSRPGSPSSIVSDIQLSRVI